MLSRQIDKILDAQTRFFSTENLKKLQISFFTFSIKLRFLVNFFSGDNFKDRIFSQENAA